jgi:hypothetical protein
MKGAATDGSRRHGSLAELRVATAERLRMRREEIDEAVVHRALSVAPPSGKEAPGYVEALRAAIPSAVEHAIDAIELGEERLGPTPAPIFVQAVASARSRVGLEVVLRRYAAGYSTISDFLHQEVRALGGGLDAAHAVLQRELTALFDRLVVEVSEAYRREEETAIPSPTERRQERIRRLLAGDLVDPSGLDYQLEGFHLAIIISGQEPERAASDLARTLGCRLLIGEASARRSAIWLGGSEPLADEQFEDAARELFGGRLRLAVGEPGEGLSGWRRTRRQAEAAHLVAERGGGDLVRYREVALVAAALRDPDLAHCLIESYVEPLAGARPPLGMTVSLFLGSSWNASSTAAALGISRQAVSARLLAVEERLDRRLGECAAELDVALRLAALEA